MQDLLGDAKWFKTHFSQVIERGNDKNALVQTPCPRLSSGRTKTVLPTGRPCPCKAARSGIEALT